MGKGGTLLSFGFAGIIHCEKWIDAYFVRILHS